MSTIAKGVNLNFGLITAAVSVKSALQPKAKTGNVQVCDTGHDPIQVRQPRTCDECGQIAFQQIKTARPVEGGFVILDANDKAAVKEFAAGLKKRAELTVHPREAVDVQTGVGDKTYYLVPEAGFEQAYAVLREAVSSHPELAFLTQWAARTAVATYQLQAMGDVLMFQERTTSVRLRPAPEVDAQAPGDLVSLLESVINANGTVKPFDPQDYEDDIEARIDELMKGRDVVQLTESETVAKTAPAQDGDDLTAALAKMMAASRPTRTKKKEPSLN